MSIPKTMKAPAVVPPLGAPRVLARSRCHAIAPGQVLMGVHAPGVLPHRLHGAMEAGR